MKSVIVVAVLAMVLCVSTGTAARSLPESPQDTLLAQMQTLLKDRSAFVWTPTAREYGANTMAVATTIQELKGLDEEAWADSLRELTKDSMQRLQSDYGAADLFNPMDDIHTASGSGFNETSIRLYLTDNMVTESVGLELRRLFAPETSQGQFFYFKIYDAGAEIIGTELLMFKPLFSNKVLIVKMEYCAA